MPHTPVSLAVDVRAACATHRTGKGQWTYGCVSELLRRTIPLTLFTDADVPREWREQARAVERIPGWGLRWHINTLRRLRSLPSATYLSPTSYIVPALAPSSVRCVPVIHDLIAFRGEPHDRKATWIEHLTLPRAVRRAFHVCTISDATKRDLLERFPLLSDDCVTPVFAGPMRETVETAQQDGGAERRRSILCIATLCPRKNQLRLIQAFTSLPENLRATHRLILAGGRGWHDDEIVRAAEQTPGIEWLGYVDDAQYESLLHTCAVFALPSLYEGFGMQILDALQRGIPVLTSNRGSLREVADGAALIVDPESVESIANGLDRLLTSEGLRQEFHDRGITRSRTYSWERTVDLLLGSLG